MAQNSGAPHLDNISSGEMIYQRFVLVNGSVNVETPTSPSNRAPFISVESVSFPVQTFACSVTGTFKALVHLQPGPQDVKFFVNGNDSEETSTVVKGVMYLPLLHVPPLHLAIMVADDSPLLMDCPPEKAASPTHSDLAAAVKKMRMWAYMSQAFTAEEMRRTGFGRRSFRLEEEWTQDTLSIWDDNPKYRMTAKIHVVKAGVKTATLRDPNLAQQNPNASQSDRLYNIFHDALQNYGGPFEAFKADPHGPVVAGLLLDSHYDPSQDLILAHAALGGTGGPFSKVHLGLVYNSWFDKSITLTLHNRMFGSHTHWAWPRFVEEIAPCLLDATRVTMRSRVGDDNGQCGTFWEACCIGQGASLHEVGHAFGLPHQTTGIMNRGYVEWNRSFVAKESYCVRTNEEAKDSFPPATTNHWHLADLLHMAKHHMFMLPSDLPVQPRAPISVRAGAQDVIISSPAGIALLEWQVEGKKVVTEDIRSKAALSEIKLTLQELHDRFGGYAHAPLFEDTKKFDTPQTMVKKLTLIATALDGSQKTIDDFWDFAVATCVPIPGSNVTVRKKSVISSHQSSQGVWKWAVLLTKLGKDGNVVRANRIKIQKGAWFDGCYIFYEDGSTDLMGAKYHPGGNKKHLGGNPTRMELNEGEVINSIEVWASHYIDGVRFSTSVRSYGTRGGYAGRDAERLEADEGEQIIGFYGKNEHDHGFCPTLEFGILTIPKDTSLPEMAYTIPALLNTDGGSRVSSNACAIQNDAYNEDDDEDEEEDDEDDE